METLETLETSGGNTKTPEVKKNRVVPCKRWCFTAFGNEIQKLSELFEGNTMPIGFGCSIGKETCPETGRPHLQGYIEYPTKIRPVEKFGTKETHWEKAKGSREDNIAYTQKEGFFFPHGFVEKQLSTPWLGNL